MVLSISHPFVGFGESIKLPFPPFYFWRLQWDVISFKSLQGDRERAVFAVFLLLIGGRSSAVSLAAGGKFASRLLVWGRGSEFSSLKCLLQRNLIFFF